MRLFDGLDRTDYQDVLRAIGLLLDEEALRFVRVIEVEEGLLVQGVRPEGRGELRLHSVLFDETRVRAILAEAYARRQTPKRPPVVDTPVLLLPHGDVALRPGARELELRLINHGAEPAARVTVVARWQTLGLTGHGGTIPPGGEKTILLTPARGPIDSLIEVHEDLVWRFRFLYTDPDGVQYDMHLDYGHEGRAWRVTRLPRVRARVGQAEIEVADHDQA